MFEEENQRKDGEVFPAEVYIGEVRAHEERLFLLVAEDVTERKRLEREREELLARLHAIVECSSNAIVLADEEGRIVLFNPAAQAMFGYSQEEALGQNLDILMPPEHKGRHQEYIRRYLETGEARILGKTRRYEQGQRKNGEVFPLQLHVNEVRVGEERLFLGIMEDLTEQKRLEEELRRSERLAAIGQASAVLGHDLRNPLGAISNAAFYLSTRLKDADPSVQRSIALIQEQVRACENIIAEILEFARPREAEMAPVDVNSLVQGVMRQTAIPENIQVTTHLDASCSEVQGDVDMLRRALANLVTNAVQAMPDGGSLEITTREREGVVELEVKDTGIGIPPENLERIFEPLFTTKSRGTGLGLPQVKYAMERHEGEVVVKSEAGQGTTFILRIPLRGGKAASAPEKGEAR